MADSLHGGLAPSDGSGLPVSLLPEKGRVVCHGQIESVTYMPADQTAAFTAIVTDLEDPRPALRAPTGRRSRLRVVWLGRRRVPGVDAGTEVRLEGMVTHSQGLTTMFNPRYEILSSQEKQ
ncbi:hypothetical protein J7E83_10110 [Arthrobacter sp. ISL-48]|uniref:hypothetical protein n=1 Tax=Arthrobacter sp. ISL-48 TaxID=2819110 RepID=UPI001BE58A06|nr:hypothetical protein [Arthrobacter sp. ISL-48]MBT2532476.1 hypothetical protein [Arthrobacter sp. ISL-48]